MVVISLLYLFLAPLSSSANKIGYSVEEQQQWHTLAEGNYKCAYGVYQSPIHIEDHFVQKTSLPALNFIGYDNLLPKPLALKNDGHTVKLTTGYWPINSVYFHPKISGNVLPGQYVFDGIHFHWGKGNDHGSEHRLNFVDYPLEMHLVHRNIAYGSISEALLHKDGLAVLAFFFRLKANGSLQLLSFNSQLQLRTNRKLRQITKKLQEINGYGNETTIWKSFSLASLLPRSLDEFFIYEGSLTTPPCTENVMWFIFPETIPISFQQIKAFRELNIHSNNRILQERGRRKVFFRTSQNDQGGAFQDLSHDQFRLRSFWLH